MTVATWLMLGVIDGLINWVRLGKLGTMSFPRAYEWQEEVSAVECQAALDAAKQDAERGHGGVRREPAGRLAGLRRREDQPLRQQRSTERGSGVTNRVRIGSRTVSDVRRIASRMHWLRPATPTLTWRSLAKNPLRNDGLSQSRYHASHPTIPAATEPTSDD